MSTITFRGAYIRHFDVRRNEGGQFVRIHFTSELTNPVREAVGWAELPSCLDSGKLEGLLTARSLVLTPNQKELRNHEIQLDCSEVRDFQVFQVKDEDSGSVRRELRFVTRSNQASAETFVGNYWRLVGEAEGALKVTYDDQQKLELDPPAKDDKVAAGAVD